MLKKIATYYKWAVVIAIAMTLIDAVFPGPVKEFLFYALVTICGVGLVILFLAILYYISRSEI